MNISIIVGGVLALICLIAAFYFLRKKRLVDDTPTSKTLGVFIGLAELKGTAESDNPLTSYLAMRRVSSTAGKLKNTGQG